MSCETNLLEHLNRFTRLVDEGYNVDVFYQRVVLNGSASDWLDVTSGVSQESVLGSTCHVIFKLTLKHLFDGLDDKYGRVIRSEEDKNEMQRIIDLEWAEKLQMHSTK